MARKAKGIVIDIRNPFDPNGDWSAVREYLERHAREIAEGKRSPFPGVEVFGCDANRERRRKRHA